MKRKENGEKNKTGEEELRKRRLLCPVKRNKRENSLRKLRKRRLREMISTKRKILLMLFPITKKLVSLTPLNLPITQTKLQSILNKRTIN
jgi:hypothetical protein